MTLQKTSEKILVWMFRNKISGQQIAKEIGISRQAWSVKMQTNVFTTQDIMTVRRMGYTGE